MVRVRPPWATESPAPAWKERKKRGERELYLSGRVLSYYALGSEFSAGN